MRGSEKSTPLNLCLKATLDVLSGVAFLCYNNSSQYIVQRFVGKIFAYCS